MRKILTSAVVVFLLLAGCKKALSPQTEIADEPQAIIERRCAANEVLQAQLAEDPLLRSRMEQIESFTQKAIRSGVTARLASDGVIEIPVVVHVVYKTADQNISDARVQSQIDVLNQDFQSRNTDFANLPAGSFQSVASKGMNVRFVLAQTIRKATTVTSWSTNDAVKLSRRGGSDAVDTRNNLNIWVCNLGGGVLGYAQFPGGKASTDGVVVLYSAFGNKATNTDGPYVEKYNLGRTATHEVGHWLNLRHIWGDDNGLCSGTDYVGDTPNQGNYNYGCPSYPKLSCNNGSTGEMFMNYMDYTDDACMYMFTEGQKSRALAVFAANGPRAAMGK